MSISPVPIVHNYLYDGPWDPLKNRRIDFCVFPMVISRVNDDEIMLSFGWQDHEGWIAYMNLHTLLDSLDPVPLSADEVGVVGRAHTHSHPHFHQHPPQGRRNMMR